MVKTYAVLFEKRFILCDYLSAGIQGQVFLVRDIETGQLYARKITKKSTYQHQQSAIGEDRLYKPHPDIVRLVPEASTTYRHSYRSTTKYREEIPRHFVTVWEFCNGNTLADMVDRCVAVNQTGRARRFADAWVWSIFSGMLNALLHLHSTPPYVVHTDNHMNNWFIHWPGWKSIPEIKLGDFGFAKQWPRARNGNVYDAKPWSHAKPGNAGARWGGDQRDHDMRELWYKAARQDHHMAVKLLMLLIMQPFEGQLDFARVCVNFGLIAKSRRSYHGYPHELLELVDEWYSIIQAAATRAGKNQQTDHVMMEELKRLRDMVQYKRDQSRSHHRQHSGEFHPDECRPPPRSDKPTLFADWRDLMPRIGRQNVGPDDFHLDLRGGGTFHKPVSLRHGEYEVAEVERGFRNNYKIVKLVPLQFM